MTIDVIIPARNEALAIGNVIAEIPRDIVREVIVSDNGSTDRTADEAARAGATVVHAPIPGYGSACLTAMHYLIDKPDVEQPDIVVFLDADYSDYPEDIPLLTDPIVNDDFDLVIGSRTAGVREPGSMTWQQVFGNRLATTLIRLIYGHRFSDLGPFRAIRWQALQGLKMKDKNYGWTVEMQVKAVRHGLRCAEVPVRYRRRIGRSKISGTISGTVKAGTKILFTIFRLAW